MNAPVYVAGPNYAKLLKQAESEAPYFVAKQMADLIEAKSATTGVLIEKINQMFLQYLQESWVPTTMQKLDAEAASIADANTKLGLPAAGGGLSPKDLQRSDGSHHRCIGLEAGLDA